MTDAHLKGKIETVLFVTSHALSIKDIADKLMEEPDAIEEALLELISDYAYREESALEIDDADGYILQVKDTYSSVVNHMMPVELSTAAVRTLSAIAIKGPLKQSDLIELRGSGAYDHIKELVENDLVSKRRKDKTFELKVTSKFHEYFKLTGDKNELEQLVNQLREDEPTEHTA